MEYHVVVCLEGNREVVLASRRMFSSVIDANRYASTIAADRRASVVPLADYLVSVGWRIAS